MNSQLLSGLRADSELFVAGWRTYFSQLWSQGRRLEDYLTGEHLP